MIYIASPYSHTESHIMEERARAVTYYCYTEIKKGNTAFSPITYGHQVRKMGTMPNDWEFWMKFCLDFLQHSDEIHVLTLDGWETSIGVKAEIEWAMAHGIPVKYVTGE